MEVAIVDSHKISDPAMVANGNLSIRDNCNVIIKPAAFTNSDRGFWTSGLQQNGSVAKPWCTAKSKVSSISDDKRSATATADGDMKAHLTAN